MTVGGSAKLQSGPAAAAGGSLSRATVVRRAGGGNGGGGAAGRRRPGSVSSPLLPFHGNPRSGFPWPLSCSHGEVTSTFQFCFLHFKTFARYSLFSSLYRREKETGCPKGNPVIQRGFGPKIG